MKKSTYSESDGHILGKELAIQMLKSMKFKHDEIYVEYPIVFPTGKLRKIDVVGISIPLGRKIAFEVGNLTGGSLEELYCFFDEVYNINKLIIETNNLRKIFEFNLEEINYYKSLLTNGYGLNLNYKYSVDEEINFLYKNIKNTYKNELKLSENIGRMNNLLNNLRQRNIGKDRSLEKEIHQIGKTIKQYDPDDTQGYY